MKSSPKYLLQLAASWTALLAVVGHDRAAADGRSSRPPHGCQDYCSGVGNCNPTNGLCECPFGYEGPSCASFVLDECRWSKGRLVTGHYQKDAYGRPGPWSAWQAQLPLALTGNGGFRYQGPRSCRCLQALFRHLRMEGKPFAMLCFNITHQQLRQLIKSGNAASTPPLHYVSTVQPEIIAAAPAREQEKWVAAGAILPLEQCQNQCSWNGWCGYESASGRGSTYTFDPEKPSDARVTCHCFADLGSQTAGGDCSGAGEGTQTWDCPLKCNERGTCQAGFCKCQEGFWGLDCGLTLDKATGEAVVWLRSASAPTMDFRPWPRIYLPDIPVQFRTKLWSNSYLLPHLATSPYRVADVAHADFFWFLHTTYVGEPLMMAMFRWWRTVHPYWDRSVQAQFPTAIVSMIWDAGCDSGFFSRPAGDQSAPWRTPDVAPNSPTRMWMGLYVNTKLDGIAAGNTTSCQICLQPGKDLLIPPHQPMVDAPGQSYPKRFLKRYSPWSPSSVPGTRNLTFFFAGAIANQGLMPSNGRGHLYRFHKDAQHPGWMIVNSQGLLRLEGVRKRKFLGIEKGMSSALFCFVPYGTVGGYGGRYLPAVLFGCIPIIWQVSSELGTALPFDELPDVDWKSCSITTHADDIEHLDKRLASIPPSEIDRMQRCLAKLWPRMLYTTWHGSYIGEDGKRDAWNGIMEVLARRLRNLTSHQRLVLADGAD